MSRAVTRRSKVVVLTDTRTPRSNLEMYCASVASNLARAPCDSPRCVRICRRRCPCIIWSLWSKMTITLEENMVQLYHDDHKKRGEGIRHGKPSPRLAASPRARGETLSSKYADGWALLLVQHQGAYKVGVLSSHQRPIPLQDSSYAAYRAAHDRLMQEAQKRRQVHP